MIRALDICRGERWTDGRITLHMVEAMAIGARRSRRRLPAFWRGVLWMLILTMTPSIAALALVAAYQILRKGLL